MTQQPTKSELVLFVFGYFVVSLVALAIFFGLVYLGKAAHRAQSQVHVPVADSPTEK